MVSPTTDAISNLVAATASTYNTDRIVLLGKGPSADKVNAAVYKDAIVIGLNDAERITPTDITIFHDEWVKASLRDAGMRSRAYVTSTDFQAPGHTVVNLPYEPLSNDEGDIMMSRFQSRDELAIEEIMLLTALEFARLIADQRGERQTVHMVGFDFAPELGYSRATETEFSPDLSGDRGEGVRIQAEVLRNALYVMRDTNLDIIHVGDHELSRMTPAEFNALVAPKPLHPGEGELEQPDVLITAEITTNHFGDRARLEQLVRAAHAAGADLVKVQKRDVETFYTAEQLAKPYASPFGTTFGEYRRALELDREDFEYLDSLCGSLGISWFASVLDQPSFKFMADLGAPLLKLPSTISEHRDYLRYVSENYSGPLVLSTGMTDQDYEDWVLSTFGKQERLYLLHCNSAYPTPDEHCNIGVVRHYAELAKDHPNLVPGYSSHDHGWMASALAVAAGAGMVEKHVKLGNTEWAHFDAVAVDLTTPAFKEYVDNVRRAQMFVGSSVKKVTPSEHHKYTIPRAGR
ncbi:N-acetylneuraminate synthase family protein [Demequina pelophila]|uniref:N-acetylneuraminate synthase family protein n=1 Tax=Demequina pelophila TaxID=1638984 RepID=UPI0007843590|nr:N-acetylneuraminate synthase family protein [Demequina pelophila]